VTGQGPLVLVVEDDPPSLRLACDVLTFAGFRTLSARSGEEALDLARLRRPDIVLMDIGLPGVDGIGALGLIRADPDLAATPVIAVTAARGPSDGDDFLTAGFDDFIPKPLEVLELPARVRRHAPGRSGAGA